MLRHLIWPAALASLFYCLGCTTNSAPPARLNTSGTKIPVILDTDIGDDIDDTWALTLLLKSPQFDVKLITTTHGQADYRARLIAKMLTIANRTDIAIGRGVGEPVGSGRIAAWVEHFDWSTYRGKVDDDGVQALIDTVNASPEPITIIAIGPLDTLAAALARAPQIASKVNLVGIQGSVFRGYPGSSGPQPEFNIKSNIPAAQKVLSAPWRSIAITPLDTCGLADVKLSGECFARLKQSDDPRIKAILESYAIWSKKPSAAELSESTILYDTVAVYLADPAGQPLLDCQMLSIKVTDDGRTTVSKDGKLMRVATGWKNLDAYRDHLMQVLLAR